MYTLVHSGIQLCGALRLERGGVLVPLSGNLFRVGSGDQRLKFEPFPGKARPRIRETGASEEDVVYELVEEFAPTASELNAFSGAYYSPDAETTLVAALEKGWLVLKRRPDTVITLIPVSKDAFQAPTLGLVRFLRDKEGKVTELSVRQDRVYDLRFERGSAPAR